MISKQNMILNAVQIDQRIIRMAYEIYENHLKAKQLVLVGIADNGHTFAVKVSKKLAEISHLETTVVKIDINKDVPHLDHIDINLSEKEMNKKAVILFDDVLNSGKTAAYALKAFLSINIKLIEVAVMVNRSHKAFPIYPKYKGYELATTITEHVEVKFVGKDKGVYLF